MVVDALDLHTFAPARFAYALAAHGTVAWPGYGGPRAPICEVLDVKDLRGAPGDERLSLIVLERCVRGECHGWQKAVRSSADWTELGVVLSEAFLCNHEEIDDLTRGELGQQNVAVHGAHATGAEFFNLE